MLQVLIDTLPGDPGFWEAYTSLWLESEYKTAFQSPLFLKVLINIIGREKIILSKGIKNVKLVATTLFYNKDGVYHFLSDLKTDHNYFVLHKDLPAGEIQQYFRDFLMEAEKRKLAFRLNSLPSWAYYADTFKKVLAERNMFYKVIDSNPCVILETPTPEELFEATDKKKFRQKLNRLKDQGNVEFEAFTGSEDIDNWLNGMFELHIKRWATTSTPSIYRDETVKEFYRSCIKSWIGQGILIRFSIKLNEKRISYVTALFEHGYLLHHTCTFDIDYEKQSPGLLIIKMIARWMADRGMTKMEFGDGGEMYKYQFTSYQLQHQTVFISGKRNYPFIIKTSLVHFFKENRKLRNFYTANLRPLMLKSGFLKKKIT
ncbi:MAG: GNAT family N-acetyltransferase [Sphingobacteriales bacterium]|nr:GNAT family N-acetyltransferase [Sphingobacteriales bacterium]MBI3717614.1 GNAT family N-acetyltransferase [Sphingobacteriales bacterium]